MQSWNMWGFWYLLLSEISCFLSYQIYRMFKKVIFISLGIFYLAYKFVFVFQWIFVVLFCFLILSFFLGFFFFFVLIMVCQLWFLFIYCWFYFFPSLDITWCFLIISHWSLLLSLSPSPLFSLFVAIYVTLAPSLFLNHVFLSLFHLPLVFLSLALIIFQCLFLFCPISSSLDISLTIVLSCLFICLLTISLSQCFSLSLLIFHSLIITLYFNCYPSHILLPFLLTFSLSLFSCSHLYSHNLSLSHFF